MSPANFFTLAFVLAFVVAAVSFGVILKINPLNGKFRITTLICWSFIALCIGSLVSVLLNSAATEVKGDISGLTIRLVGPAAFFFLIWYFGLKQASDMTDLDRRQAEELAGKDKLIGDRTLDCEGLQAEKERLLKAIEVKDAEILLLKNKPKSLSSGVEHAYELNNKKGKRIVLVTGGIQEVVNADALVNSENTHMFMSRPMESTVSGILRAHGSIKKDGRVVDAIADELAQKVSGHSLPVPAGSVFVTSAGDLARNGVRWIFHVASVEGTPGYGFRPVANISECVVNVLEEASKPELGVRKIVFPLLGTGTAGGDMKELSGILFDSAISFLVKRSSPVEAVCFSVLTQHHLNVCQEALATRAVSPV